MKIYSSSLKTFSKLKHFQMFHHLKALIFIYLYIFIECIIGESDIIMQPLRLTFLEFFSFIQQGLKVEFCQQVELYLAQMW